jgi:hypothetical protein
MISPPRMTHKNLLRCGAQAPRCFLPEGSWGQRTQTQRICTQRTHCSLQAGQSLSDRCYSLSRTAPFWFLDPRCLMTGQSLSDRCYSQSQTFIQAKRVIQRALKFSDSSLKTSHPWAEASVVVCTGARSLDRDCFYSQNLTCVCSDWLPMLPLKYLLAMPKLRFYTEWTLLFL